MPGLKGLRENNGSGSGGGAPARGGKAGGRAVVANGVMGAKDRQRRRTVATAGHVRLRYSPEEAEAGKKEIERGLRLRRLQQVREQCRQHAAAVREEYRQRKREGMKQAVEESRRNFETARVAELYALNLDLQKRLLGVGSAHRLAAHQDLVRMEEEDRLSAERLASAKQTRVRTARAALKRAGELQEAAREEEVAQKRLEVWRGEGKDGRASAADTGRKRASKAAMIHQRREHQQGRLREKAQQCGVAKAAGGRVAQVGPRLEDFKTSHVHAAMVLRHGTAQGTHLMGVENAVDNASKEEQRRIAVLSERREASTAAAHKAEERGKEAMDAVKDQRMASGVEEELARWHHLDRQKRQGRGAAMSNLAAMRQREVRRAKAKKVEGEDQPALTANDAHAAVYGTPNHECAADGATGHSSTGNRETVQEHGGHGS
ncbi:unnamed protein product, partial [Discosporangium mesarthrocarpum]